MSSNSGLLPPPEPGEAYRYRPLPTITVGGREVPVCRVEMPSNVYASIHVLERRKDKRRHKRRCRRRAHQREVAQRVAARHRERIRVRTWRQEYPWHVRYPNLGRVVFATMLLGCVALYIMAPS